VNKLDAYHYTVRIPSINKSGSAVGRTPDSELYTATVCTPPGVIPAYITGCAVFVLFENTDYSAPVIIGALMNETAEKLQSDMKPTSLVVSTNVTLPTDTNIGAVSPSSIQTLLGQQESIKHTFEENTRFHNDITVDINNINDSIIYMKEHDIASDYAADVLKQRVTVSEEDIEDLSDYLNELKSDVDDLDKELGDPAQGSNPATGMYLITDNIKQSLNNHINESGVTNTQKLKHISENERGAWNGHINNSDIHVSAADKNTWNTHKNDSTMHVSSQDRTNWNSKADSNHTHSEYSGSSHSHSELLNLSKMVLASGLYGKTTPSNPTTGQLFFKLEE